MTVNFGMIIGFILLAVGLILLLNEINAGISGFIMGWGVSMFLLSWLELMDWYTGK